MLETQPTFPSLRSVPSCKTWPGDLCTCMAAVRPSSHRDLTARNVLLNSAMVAKIDNMSNSRIVNIQLGQLSRTMTTGVPGTIVYMPPEAFEVPPKYGPKLDMFSFGHLALFIVTQQFSGDLLPANYQDQHSRRLIPRNEIESRSRYMDSLHTMLGWSHGLITQCLDYTPSARPTASQAMDRLQHISSHIQDDYHSMTHAS